MKTINYILTACIIICMSACDLDNFDGPDAKVFGSLIDDETNELIEQEIGTSGDAANIQVIELGYNIRSVQKWKIMTTGEYRNNLVFSGNYDIIMNNGNFVKLDTLKDYRIKKGENKLDFRLIPNIRIKNPKVEKTANAIVATFNLEYGHENGKVKEIALFGQADQNPSKSFHLCQVNSNIEDQDISYATNPVNRNREFKLTIDLDSDAGKKLQAGKKYFFRIGAIATGLGNGIQEKYNYAPVVGVQM